MKKWKEVEWKDVEICHLPLRYYLPLLAVLCAAIWTGSLNRDIVGTTAFLVLVGGLLSFVGGKLPVVHKWLAGSILVPMLGGSVLVYARLIPSFLAEQVDAFISSGFINVILGAVIVGSILSIDRETLKKVSLNLLPCILIAQAGIVLSLFLGTVLARMPFLEGVYLIGMPNFCGGSSASLVAIPEICIGLFGGSVPEYAGRFMISLVIANLFSILFAGLLDWLGKRTPKLTGNGKLLELDEAEPPQETGKHTRSKNHYLGIGCAASLMVLVCGSLISHFLPVLNYIAWATILILLLKLSGVMNENICFGAQLWQEFMMELFIPAAILGVGISSVDLGGILSYLSAGNLIVIFCGVLGGLLGSLISSKVFGMYPLDTMITIGCNSATIGGSGTIAVLSSAKRMELIPYATIANRLGGAVMLVIYSVTISFFVP